MKHRVLFMLIFVVVCLCFGAATSLGAGSSTTSPTSGAPASNQVLPANYSGPIKDNILSDQRYVTRWAYVQWLATIRSRPSKQGRDVGKLHYNTSDGMPEVYMARKSVVNSKGQLWIEIDLLGRYSNGTDSNGRVGWVPRGSLGSFHVVTTFLSVDQETLTATLYRGNKVIFTSRVGMGKPSTPTPHGHFYIRELLRNLGGDPLYGPWAFGTSAYSNIETDWPGGGVVGIHGTDQPYLIPGRPSHGCVRLPNYKITQLAKLMPIGTPVWIH